MFGFRTPDPKQHLASKEASKLVAEAHTDMRSDEQPSRVRLSVGEIEARTSVSPVPPHKDTDQPESARSKSHAAPAPASAAHRSTAKASSQKGKPTPAPIAADSSPKQSPKYKNRMTEAKACLAKVKMHLADCRNIKGENKVGIQVAADRLYNLVKESEEDKSAPTVEKEPEKKIEDKDTQKRDDDMLRKIEEHGRLLKENKEEMERLTAILKSQQETMMENRSTYASVAAGSPRRQIPEVTAMHSIIVASKDDQETGDQVFERIRKVVNAKEEGVRIDRVRKAKDRKIIVGCRNRDEIRRIKASIAEQEGQLSVEDVKNKDPLIILYGVLQSNSDDDVIKAIRTQNKHILANVSKEEDRMEVRYRRRARNPLTSHIVIKVSPHIWQRFTAAGAVHIDMQRIRVADQSPLIQCSRCLGYGHGKRFCPDAIDVCSHCGGAHLKEDCAEYLSDSPPCCVNCSKAKSGRVDHNAFSSECPVRRKWDTLARSTVAYC